MVFDYTDGQSLEDCLYAAIHVYEDSRTNYLAGFEGDAREIVSIFTALSKQLAEGVFDLSVHPELIELYRRGNSIQSILNELNQDIFRRIVLEPLEIEMAFRFSTDVGAMAERTLELSEFLLTEPLSPHTLKFVQRVTRSYIAGFFPECVILCRAVLEQALRSRYLDAGEQLPAQQRDRIDGAHRRRWLSDKGKRAAHTVWTRGNKAVHEDPQITTDVLGTIRLLGTVLGDLERSRVAN
jgi:hypothetical protein